MNKLISIIVPAYNVENYIDNCIISVLQQTYQDWELIVINDGSSDRTASIVDKYAEEYKNIFVLHQPNLGVSSARNNGIDMAHGDYFLFLDADDWLEEDMLETMMSEGQCSDMIVCGVNNCVQEGDGTITAISRKIWDTQHSFSTDNVYLDVFCKTATLWNKLISKPAVDSIRFDPEMTYGEDAHFLAMVLPNIQNCFIIPRSLYNYLKVREGNVVSSRIDERSLQFLDNTVKTYHFLNSVGKGKYGVFRVKSAVHEVLSKIEDLDDDSCRPYIRKCSYALRQISFRDLISFIFDSKIQKSVSKRLFILLLTYCPKFATKLRRKKINRFDE